MAETELALHLWKELAPEVEGELVVCVADDGNEVILPGLNGFFGNVAAMIVRSQKEQVGMTCESQ